MYVYLIQILVTIVVLYTVKVSVLEPVLWEEPNPLPALEGNLKPNTLLGIENVYHFTEHIAGPESTAIDSETGYVYAGFSDGTVGSFNWDGKEFKVIHRQLFFTGAFIQNYNQEQAQNLTDWCHAQQKMGKIPWNPSSERICGRPLGLRFRKEGDDKFLYILDAYYGLFKLNLNSNEVHHLFNEKTPIYSVENADDSTQYPIRFFNDLDIFNNGNIVFTDSSYKNTRSQNRQEVLDAAPRGRLFLYQPSKKLLSVKLCGLHFPNGVQVFHSKEKTESHEIIVAEATRFRLLKVNLDADFLKGTSSLQTSTSDDHITAFSSCGEKGSLYHMLKEDNYEVTGVSIFADSLPGFADNIRLDLQSGKNEEKELKNYYLVGLGTISKQPFSLLWTIYQAPLFIREAIGKLIPMKYVEKLVPKYGIVVVIDERGKIVSSLQDPSGKGASLVSQAERHPITGDLWLGSHSEKFVVVPAKNLPTSWE